MNKWITTLTTASLVAGLAIAGSLQAQDQPDSTDFTEDRSSPRTEDRQLDGSRSDRQQRQTDQRTGKQIKLKPTGWIRIGYDTDGDGRFDTVETIYGFDLIQARQASQGRKGQQGQRRQTAFRGEKTVQGTIQETHTQRLSGIDDPHLMARIKTEEGRTAKVDLGPKKKLSQAELSEGTEITVTGRRGRINDRSMLLATSIKTGDRTFQVERPRNQRHKRVRGTIENLKTKSFRGKDSDYSVAEIDLNKGRSEQVVLGPKSKLEKLDLQEGDDVSLIVCGCKLNGKKAFQAVEVHANDETVKLPHKRKHRTGSKSRSGQTSADRGEKKHSGQVLSTRKAKFRGVDEQHVVAEVRLDSGSVKTINLGPESRVSRMDLSSGDSIDFTARSGRINGESALIAETITSGGQTVNLPRPQDRERFGGSESQTRR